MFPSAALLLMAALSTPVAAGSSPNQVRVCSVVEHTCSSLPASALDPTVHHGPTGGQLAFVDPVTGERTEPTAEQADALQQEITLSEKRSVAAPTVRRLASGALRLDGDFGIYLQAEIRPATKGGDSAKTATRTQGTATASEKKP